MTAKRHGRVRGSLAGCALFVSSIAAVAAAPARPGRDKTSNIGPVHGHVVNESGQGVLDGLAGMKGHDPVALEREGRFSFAKVVASYDLWVANQRRDTIVLYRGLTRRDPVIRLPQGNESPPKPPHSGTLRGILRGEFPFPVEGGYLVNLGFFADRAKAFLQMGQYMPNGGPRFGWDLRWAGEPTLRGTVVAFGIHKEKDKPGTEAFLASQSVSLLPDAEARLELKLAPVPMGHIAGVVDIVHKDIVRDIYFAYRLAKAPGEIGFGNCPVRKTYDCPLPDVTALAGTYCATVSFMFPYRDANSTVTKCGGKLGMTDFSIHVGPAPQLEAPRPGSTVTRQSRLSWTDAEQGVYQVELVADSRMAVKPTIEIFTTDKQLDWPELEGLGLAFPAGAGYRLQVSRLSPYRSVDELVSGRALSGSPDESQKITSEAVDVKLTE
jgi:hypothetical protein